MSFDIAVIGGGIAGISVAAELSPGARVVLIEAEDSLGYHASGRSAAMFLPFYGNATVCALNDASADAHDAANVLTPRRFLSVAPEAQLDVLERAASVSGLKKITVEDACALLPILNRDRLRGAAVTNEAWELDTDLLIQTFRKTLLANGGNVETGARIDRITRCDDGWRVSWPGDEIRTATLINAAGAWADQVARLAGLAPLGLVPHRRSIAQLAAPAGHDVKDWPFVEQAGEDWYAKPDAGRWLVSPADEDPVEPGDAWADDIVVAEGLARYQDAVTVPVTKPLVTWAGLRTIAPDRTLVVGRDPRESAFWWCAGQAGYGFQTAPAVARMVAQLVNGVATDLPTVVVKALDPQRLI